ncbi:bifunctional riboflavin kinase/FAD synthetase [Bacteroides sp. OttesenSCG-928-J23]|nr:bifunctional riboflavin kinase/FAD synthetase [Bacteroides sp. OttesenSCG-928-J23]
MPQQLCVASIGFFDGVHVGHRYLISQVKEAASRLGMASALITFPVHPRLVMNADYTPELLTSYEEKIDLLAATGIDYCIVLPFTPDIARFTARDFMNTILKNQCHVGALVIGHDHRFGHNRTDDFTDYCAYGRELGIEVIRGRACVLHNTTVSSSVIRRLIREGDIALANRYLGYNYRLEGVVTDGHKVGRTLGFPTANLQIRQTFKLLPPDGVYAVHVEVDGKEYAGMLNIGQRPTMDNGTNRSIEVHILQFNSDIYDFPLTLRFVQFIRNELKFASKEALKEQLEADRRRVEELL